jgi:hypothetical protein
MGCLRGVGCLVLVVAVAAAAWWFRADWLPLLHKGTTAGVVSDSASTVVWEPVTPEGAARAKKVVARLGARSGRYSPTFLRAISPRTSSRSSPSSSRRPRTTWRRR